MALANGREELLDCQSHVWNHIYNYVNSMSLKCAIQLGIPDAIHKRGKPMSVSQLADALTITGAKSGALRRLMRILAHSKFFEIVNNDDDEEEAYGLTGASRLLLTGEPRSMVPFVLLMLDPIAMDPWHCIAEWFRDECSSPFETKNGMTFWEFAAGGDGRLNELFNEGMASDAGFVTTILLGKKSRHVFDGLKSMVDVGGGVGATAKGVAAAFPGLKCTVLDRPHVVAGLKGSENLRFVGGDMFESIPHADAVFLKWILHDWSDKDSVKILRKCREAITGGENNGGKVILVELVVDDRKEEHKATETQLFFDMQMMAVTEGGRERSEKEWAAIFFAAGFDNYKITPILGLRSVIEVFPSSIS